MVVGGILFPERNSDRDTGSRMHPENEDFREFSGFVEIIPGESGRLLERLKKFESAFINVRMDLNWFFEGESICKRIVEKCDFSSRRVPPMQWFVCKRKISGRKKALRVIPRGKQWLTVYRAHQVLGGFSKKYFTKMVISRDAVERLC